MYKDNSLFSLFLGFSRSVKRIISLFYDSLAIVVCVFLSFLISNNAFNLNESSFQLLFITLSSSLFIFARVGLYRAILRYMGMKAIFTIVNAVTLSAIIFSLSSHFLKPPLLLVNSFLYWSFCLIAVGGSRLIAIAIIRSKSKLAKLPIAIYGAGDSGRELARALSQSKKYELQAYIDDDPLIFNSVIDGVKVYSPVLIEQIIKHYGVGQILLAMPSETHARRSEILSSLEPYPVKVKTIGSMEDIISGKSQIEQLKDIEIEDLLGRDPIEPNKELLHSSITNKVVMVTGAGGSIGAELCRQISLLQPFSIILYELSEFGLYSIEKKLRKLSKEKKLTLKIIPLLGSVQHKNRLIQAMSHYKVQTVYHAAAYKHVPIVEHNIVEGIRNNVFGTWYAAEAAIAASVERFVLVSTDKAVRPTNVMGASKRLAELVLQALNTRECSTVFTMVRFGNVLGSSGSVVPLFRDQIKSGGPITVTHKDIIRYFMTIPEAAQLVIQAGSMGAGGDVFVLDMGDQVKIADLAERMIHLMGYSVKNANNPNGDIEIQFSGLRPGEKLYEELLVGENVIGTEHPKIMSANEELLSWSDMHKALILLNELCDLMDCESIVQLLLKVPTGYNPQHAVCDLLWDQDKDKNNVVRFKTLT